MKKLKKALSLVLALTLTASVLPLTIASAEDVVYPNVLLYRDYEDYTGGSDILNTSDCKYGSLPFVATPSNKFTAVMQNGADGKAVKITNINGVREWHVSPAFSSPISEGKFYITYNIQKPADSDIPDNSQHIFNTMLYKGSYYFNQVKIGVGKSTVDYDTTGKDAVYRTGYYGLIRDENVHKVEIIFDLGETDDSVRGYVYIDGEQKDMIQQDTSTYIDKFRFTFTRLAQFDNVALIHYPNDATNTFSMKESKYDSTNDAILVSFKSDTTAKNGYKAPYTVTLSNPTDIEVKDSEDNEVTVSEVTRTASGEYSIKLEGGTKPGEVYKISGDSLTDLVGATLKEPAYCVIPGGLDIIAFDEEYQQDDYAFDTLSSGKLYFAYDIKRTEEGKTERVETVYDLTEQNTLSGVSIEETDYVEIKNVTVIHYPENVSSTFSMLGETEANAIKASARDNKLVVKFKSNASENSLVENQIVKKEAKHPVMLASAEPDDFVVTKDGTELTDGILSVEAGSVSGEYVITLKDDIKEGSTYTLTLKGEGVKDASGLLSFKASTAEIKVPEAKITSIADKTVEGDKVKVSVKYTYEGIREISGFLSSIAVYDGNKMIGFDYKPGAGLTIESDNTTCEYEFAKSEVNGKEIKAFAWKALGSRVPLGEAVIAE